MSKGWAVQNRIGCSKSPQARLAKSLESGLFAFDNSKEAQEHWLDEVCPGSKVGSLKNLNHAAVQVAEKQWSNPELTLDDSRRQLPQVVSALQSRAFLVAMSASWSFAWKCDRKLLRHL